MVFCLLEWLLSSRHPTKWKKLHKTMKGQKYLEISTTQGNGKGFNWNISIDHKLTSTYTQNCHYFIFLCGYP